MLFVDAYMNFNKPSLNIKKLSKSFRIFLDWYFELIRMRIMNFLKCLIFELRNVVDVFCSVCFSNDGDIFE